LARQRGILLDVCRYIRVPRLISMTSLDNVVAAREIRRNAYFARCDFLRIPR